SAVISPFPLIPLCVRSFLSFFFFIAPPPTEFYTLSLHDALPICLGIADRHFYFARRMLHRVQDRNEIRALFGRPVKQSIGIDRGDRKSTRLNSSHVSISYAVFCLKKKKK